MSRPWNSARVAYLTRGLLSVIFSTTSSVIITERLASLQCLRAFPWLLLVVFLGAAALRFAAYVLTDSDTAATKGHSTWCQTHSSCSGQMAWKSGQDKRTPWTTCAGRDQGTSSWADC
ncbi:hypothetical protein BDR03DRAFT_953637 [Suillus americanus]|nr:hypothetical protein BDR03DRAFT_953637 [Suillus americanus]